jgi:ABC-type antimicrobial peptide transport system permease subunit
MLTVTAVSQRYSTVVNQSYSIYSSDVVVISRASFLIAGLPLGGAIPEATVSLVKGVSGVASATPMLMVFDVSQAVPTNITIGIPIQNFSMFGRSTSIQIEGTYPTSDDQVVVGHYLATLSGLKVGSTLKEGGISLRVSGIISTSNLILGNAVVMPLKTAQSTQGYEGLVSAILVDSDGVQPSALMGSIDSMIPGVRAIDPAQSEFLINPLTSSIDTISNGMEALSVTLAVLFATIIASVNIMEQKNEFSTMRAIGSSSHSVLKVTMAETGLISSTGLVIGLTLSIFTTAVVFRTFASVPMIVSISDAYKLIPLPVVLFAGLAVVGSGLLVGAVTTTTMLRKLN